MPRADGAFLSDDPQALVSQASVANIPFVTGVSTRISHTSIIYLRCGISLPGLRRRGDIIFADCHDEYHVSTRLPPVSPAPPVISRRSLFRSRTDDELRTYLQMVYFPEITPSQLDTLLQLYPQDPAQGSPFNTGDMNVLSPQYKRLSAMQGDMEFEAPRRFFLSETSGKQRTFAFCE